MMVGKFTDPVESEAMSGFRCSEEPRALGSRPRPPVENWTIMPGQCCRTPSCTAAKRSGSEEGVSSSLRTWIWTRLAPASKASCVDSTCSATVIGTAGLSFLRGTEPVIATATTTGLMGVSSLGSDIEENGLALALKIDVEHVRDLPSPLLAARDQGFAPRGLLDDVEDRVCGVGLLLVGEVHPGRKADIDAPGREPDVDMGRHRLVAVPTRHGARLDGLECI